MNQDDPRGDPGSSPFENGSEVVEELGLTGELLRIEQTPLGERAAGYLLLQEQLRVRLENADRDR